MKFLLITSQYYHSRHCFICELNEETFEKQGIELIEELEKYKRQSDDTRDFYYGDFNKKYFRKDKERFNVNDSGDIYFEVFDSVNACVYEISEYQEKSRMQSRGYQKKSITENISEHHNYGEIKSIVKNHFTIV